MSNISHNIRLAARILTGANDQTVPAMLHGISQAYQQLDIQERLAWSGACFRKIRIGVRAAIYEDKIFPNSTEDFKGQDGALALALCGGHYIDQILNHAYMIERISKGETLAQGVQAQQIKAAKEVAANLSGTTPDEYQAALLADKNNRYQHAEGLISTMQTMKENNQDNQNIFVPDIKTVCAVIKEIMPWISEEILMHFKNVAIGKRSQFKPLMPLGKYNA